MPKKIAFVYDWLDSQGGAERVLTVLREAYPEADWYTSQVDRRLPWLRGWTVKTTFLQKFPACIRRSRLWSLLLYPYAFESLDLTGYDVVVSVTSAFAKSVITRADTVHICYLLTPPRWLWDEEQFLTYTKPHVTLFYPWIRRVRRYLQRWDFQTAQRVDRFICISQEVRKRCQRHYQRESEVLYPPFDWEYWEKLRKEKGGGIKGKGQGAYFLVVGRLEGYKRVDMAIRAFGLYLERTGGTENLTIIGRGTQREELHRLVSSLRLQSRVSFVADISDEELARYYTGATALIMPQVEDLGYVACEAIACRCPVVAYVRGGQVEIITEDKTGITFSEPSAGSIASALEKVRDIEYNPDSYENSHLRRWGRDTFVATLTEKITQAV